MCGVGRSSFSVSFIWRSRFISTYSSGYNGTVQASVSSSWHPVTLRPLSVGLWISPQIAPSHVSLPHLPPIEPRPAETVTTHYPRCFPAPLRHICLQHLTLSLTLNSAEVYFPPKSSVRNPEPNRDGEHDGARLFLGLLCWGAAEFTLQPLSECRLLDLGMSSPVRPQVGAVWLRPHLTYTTYRGDVSSSSSWSFTRVRGE